MTDPGRAVDSHPRWSVVAIVLTAWTGLSTWALASWYPAAPQLMVVATALLPGLLATAGCIEVAERIGWLSRPRWPMARKRVPRWILWVEDLLFGSVTVFVAGTVGDHLHRAYPLAPGWMPYIPPLVFVGMGVGAFERALNSVVARRWGEETDPMS